MDWFERFDDRLWLSAAPPAAAEVAFIRRVLHLRKGQRVLDCPCGNGRIARELAAAGCRVAGVDFKPAFIQAARRHLRKKNLHAEFHVGDMRRLDFDGEFHAALNWSGSFGYFDDEDNQRTLTALARAVRPGGRVLIDQFNREFFLRNFASVSTRGDIVAHNHWNAKLQRMESVWTARRDGRKVESALSLRLYRLGEFRAMFAAAGLAVETVYGDLDGTPHSRTSRRIILVGRK